MSAAPARRRLDHELVARGLVPTREKARGLILAGRVRVDGALADKPGRRVDGAAPIEVIAPACPYVGRGGLKLEAALDGFAIDPAGRRALDVGASTGGFTDCLLARGAAEVTAVDVGRGQLDWTLRGDPRVVVREGLNARHLAPGDLDDPFDLATLDLSFISLRLVLPAVAPLVPAGPLVALVKPQFEVGRRDVGRGGIVRDAGLHAAAIRSVAACLGDLGRGIRGVVASPLPGAKGNREFFLAADPAAGLAEDELEARIERITGVQPS